MGVGKSTIGAEVAARLALPLLDSDREIEREMSRTGAAIAASEGVEALHAIELAAFAAMTRRPSLSVIVTAASVMDDPVGRDLLRSHLSIWLDADERTLAQRRRSGSHRRPIERSESVRLNRTRAESASVCTVATVDATASVDECATSVLDVVRAASETS